MILIKCANLIILIHKMMEFIFSLFKNQQGLFFLFNNQFPKTIFAVSQLNHKRTLSAILIIK